MIENTLYIGIDPSMTATGMWRNIPDRGINNGMVFPATKFSLVLRDYIPSLENVVVAIEMPKKTDGNRATGVGNTRVVRACATQMVKDIKELFPLRGPGAVKSRVIYEVTPETWRLWAYWRAKWGTDAAKAKAVAMTGIADHNIAEAALLCALAEWWWLNNVEDPSVNGWDLTWRCCAFIDEKFKKSEVV